MNQAVYQKLQSVELVGLGLLYKKAQHVVHITSASYDARDRNALARISSHMARYAHIDQKDSLTSFIGMQRNPHGGQSTSVSPAAYIEALVSILDRFDINDLYVLDRIALRYARVVGEITDGSLEVIQMVD